MACQFIKGMATRKKMEDEI